MIATQKLSDEQLAGQRLMAGFDGTAMNKDLEFLIGTLRVGGLIFFSQNLTTPNDIGFLCSEIQSFAKSCDQPPLFIAIDQEGGQVARLKEPFARFPGNPEIKEKEDALNFARITAYELSGIGVNMNMAPVLDVAPENISSIMAGRSFGSDPVHVSELGSAVIEQLQEFRIMAVAKHFPGIGRTVLDSHEELPSCEVSVDELESSDLIPFESAITSGVSGIMLSHIHFPGIDKKWPASLSIRIAKGILRDRMGYNGVVMTDDLDMGAIKKHFDIETAISRILLADIDMALICHKGPDIEIAFTSVLNAIRDSKEVEEKGRESVERILSLKEIFLKD